MFRPMHYTEHVHIAAGGEGSRLRNYMSELGLSADYPKHLLETGEPNNRTLLGRIVNQALEITTQPIIYAHRDTAPRISNHPDVSPAAKVVIAPPDASFFGPIIRALLLNETVTIGASGDYYTDDRPWGTMLDAHDSGLFPVTFAAAQTAPVDAGLVFAVGPNGQITGFNRSNRTRHDDLINIGLYVISPSESVKKSLAKLGIELSALTHPLTQPPEAIAAQLVMDGLVGIHELPADTAFNVNSPETYENLLRHTSTQASLTT